MKIKMIETKLGSPNGNDCKEFISGKVYDMQGAGYEDLANVFLSEKWAEEVDLQRGVSISEPEDGKADIKVLRSQPQTEEEQIKVIMVAIRELDESSDKDFNADGKPSVIGVERRLGWKPSRELINVAYEKIELIEIAKKNIDEIDLNGLTRQELNDIAGNLGIDNAVKLKNNDEVKNAIEFKIIEIKAAMELEGNE